MPNNRVPRTKHEVVEAIRAEPDWETLADLSAKYGVSITTIWNIRNQKTHADKTQTLTSQQHIEIRTARDVLCQELSTKYEVSNADIRAIWRKQTN